MHMDTKALFTQRFEAARTALAAGNEPAAAESFHWAIVAARSDPSLRRELASALFLLGKLSRKLGRAGEAEAGPLLTESLAISEELFGREHAALGPVLNELSRLHLQQSQHARAEQTLERLLAIARLKGKEHLDVAAALGGLAFVKRKIGDDASAEELYRDALRIRDKVLEPNHALIVGTLEQLSETCAARGNFAEALALLNRALPAREAALGAGHERVRTMRSRIAKFELEIAIAADTAAAQAARASRDATPTPVWLQRVPESPAETSSTAVPSPINSKKLEFIGDSEPQVLRPATRARERSMTPTVAAAVAASLMASSIRTPSASQMVIPGPDSVRPSGNVPGRVSGAIHRDLVLADVVLAVVGQSDVAGNDAALGERPSTIESQRVDAPQPARKQRTALYVSAAVASIVIAIAGLLMFRPHGGSGTPPVVAATSVPEGSAGVGAPVMMAPVTTTVSTAAAAAAVVGATHRDSLRSASAVPAHAVGDVQSEQHAAESVAPELHTPRVDIHVDPINIPMPAALSADSILRAAAARQRASDTGRAAAGAGVSLATPAEVPAARVPPKLIGRVPQPVFPQALINSKQREGQVVVRFMVNELGTVDVASMIVERSDNDLFTDAVRDILPQFRFQPARTLGAESKPVIAWVTVPFRFTTKK
jgi:TonB family protein